MNSILKIAPARILLIGFLIVVFVGAVLLFMPFSNTKGVTFVDALYTATSSTCVTGLIVNDTPVDYNFVGQLIILLLIQIGGLGYMSLATFLAILVGRRIGLSGQILLKESLNLDSLEGLFRFIKGVVLFVFITEAVGAIILTIRFCSDFSFWEALFKGVFHSVSAFNNAGFSLFSDNLIRYRGDITVNIVIMSLIVLGGLGFIVVADVYWRARGLRIRLMSHSHIVIKTTIFLIVVGAISIYLSERNFLFSRADFSLKDTVLTSLFASVTPRTAGYSTVDYALLAPTTLFITMVLMFIGASPGGTGGGVKTSTFTVAMAYILSTLKGQSETTIFKRRVPKPIVARAFVIITLSLVFISVMTMMIMSVDKTLFEGTMFEVISAFGTVGLSVGNGSVLSLSAKFSDFSKIMIIITMLAGRLGPLTLFMALMKQREDKIKYPEGRIFVG